MRASHSLARAVLVHSDINKPIATAGAEHPLTVNFTLEDDTASARYQITAPDHENHRAE